MGVAAVANAPESSATAATPPATNGSTPVGLTLDVNGKKLKVTVLPDTPIAHAVRDAGLTGTKLSCEAGACGACTVHVDGAPRNGCLALAIELEGARVTTIEGVGSPDVPEALHPVQKAILEADALQCGYCTPGFVMAGVAFFDRFRASGRTGRPSVDEVTTALAGNLCRCGCQPALLEALAAACAGAVARPPGGPVLHEERAVSRVDGPEKVTGRARFSSDVKLPRMLHGAFVRSTVPHARIRAIDVAAAKASPGVVDVDLFPIERKDGVGKLRYVGQPIAVVVAETEAQAVAGARAVLVDVEPLPFLLDAEVAARDGAPLVWDEKDRGEVPNAAEGPKEPEAFRRWRGNVRGELIVGGGSSDAGARAVARSAVRAELDVSTQVQMHATLERHGCVAQWEGGVLTIHTGSQAVGLTALDVAARLKLPHGKVRIVSDHVGGAFGSKASAKVEHIVAARMAMKTGRPVRIFLAPADHLLVGGNRPATRQRIAVGARDDGTLEAVDHEGRVHCGIAVGERTTGWTAPHAPWKAHTTRDENVVTNTAPAMPFRAPGAPGNAFALEQAVDEIAVKTGKHPLLVRLEGDDEDARRRVYRAAFDKLGSRTSTTTSTGTGRFVRGTGIATAQWWVLSSPQCTVEIRAHRDGTVDVTSAVHDLGQGARSVIANLVHDELGLPASAIDVRIGDSALTPGCGAFGSITTPSVSRATLEACLALKAELVAAARKVHGAVEATPSGVVARQKLIRWHELFAALPATPVVVLGRRGDDTHGYAMPPGKLGALAEHMPAAVSQDLAVSVQVADVEVDRLLGRVRVRRVDVFLDAGRVASPITARTQVVGAVIQGTSRALYEERHIDPRSGHNLTNTLERYPILGVADAPEIVVHFVEATDKHNPAGTLGLGENSTIATCAAIANGFRRATGRRITTTPMTPARVLEVLA